MLTVPSHSEMLLLYLLGLGACFEHVATAKPLNLPNVQSLTLPYNFTDLWLPTNQSSLLVNTTPSSNALNIQCDGGRYGFFPDVADCRSVRDGIPDLGDFVFVDRQDDPPAIGLQSLPLPFRLMGGKQENQVVPFPLSSSCASWYQLV